MNAKPSFLARKVALALGAVVRPLESPWSRLEHAALERGVLDRVDAALIRSLARRVEKAEDMAFRAVVGCLLSAVKSGSLRIPLDPAVLAARLEDFLRSLLSIPEDIDPMAPMAGSESQAPLAAAEAAEDAEAQDAKALAARLAVEFDAHRLSGDYSAVLGSPPEFLPLLQSGGGLYFQKHRAAEAAVSFRLAALLSAPDSGLPAERIGSFLDTVLHRLPLRLSSSPGAPAMVFDRRQQEAMALALRKRFMVISGGPGTGKTSLAANLLRAWTRAWSSLQGDGAAPPRIRLAAPTGRAAQRLADSLRSSMESVRHDPGSAESEPDAFVAQLACETLHGLLRYNPGAGDFFHQHHRPIPADLILVDEVSMVDIFALSRLLDAMEDRACLVLLGDMDQLPSVESGSVLADLVPAAGDTGHALQDHLVVLDRSHRSEAAILEVTRRINAMDGEAALASMAAPLALATAPLAAAASPLPLTFLEGDRKVSSGGGCRMLQPGKFPGSGASQGLGQAAEYRAGCAAWLDAWIDFHYLGYPFNPGNFPGRVLATPRSASYETLVAGLCEYRPPEDALFHAALAWKPGSAGSAPGSAGSAPGTAGSAPDRAGDPQFMRWLADLGELFAYLDQARILTFTRKGWHGSVSINRRIRERLIRRWDPRASAASAPAVSAAGTEGFKGAPILILENDHAKGLFNGDVGVLLRLAGRTMAFFRRADSFLAFPAPFLPRHELAFASTVHKAQGSEYDQVLLILPESGNRLLFKETLYTALTRARFFAGVYGPREVFLEAVGRKVVRESGLREFLSAQVPSGAA